MEPESKYISNCLHARVRISPNLRRRLSLAVAAIFTMSPIVGSYVLSPLPVAAVSPDIVISELRTKGPSGGSDEFIEIFNRSANPVDISGYKLLGCTPGSTGTVTTTPRTTVPAGTTPIPSRGYYLFTNSVGYTGVISGDRAYSTGINDSGGVEIVRADGTTVADKVSFATGNECTETTGLALVAGNPDYSYERKPLGRNGQDTDNNANDFTLNPSSSNPQNSSSPTLARVDDFTATQTGAGTLLAWNTGFEVDNLGFNVYREVAGKRTLLNPSLVAGSALRAAGGAAPAGAGYSWVDSATVMGKAQATYWLEDVDLNGYRTMHGPIKPVAFTSTSSGAPKQVQANSPLLAELGNSQALTVQSVVMPKSAAASSASGLQWTPNPVVVQRALAAQPTVKIMVRGTGWYRVTQQALVDAGFSAKGEPSTLQLYTDGEQVPILMSGWGAADTAGAAYIEFYGTALDTPTTDTRTYWLTYGAQPGRRIGTIAKGRESSEGAATDSGSNSFSYTIENKPRTIYAPFVLNGEASNFFGPVISNTPLTQILSVSNLSPEQGSAAQLEVALQGATLGNHQIQVQLNGSELGAINFADRDASVTRFEVPNDALLEGRNTVVLTSVSGSSDISLVDYTRLTYAHTYMAENDKLTFTASQGQLVNIGGFSKPGIRVVDVTDPAQPFTLTPAVSPAEGGYVATITAANEGTRTLLAFVDSQTVSPTAIAANQPSSWYNYTQGADIMVIAHSSFLSSVQPLVALRRSEGYRVAVVNIEDVYDEFSYGTHTPNAIQDLLQWSQGHWSQTPRFVLLVGDSSYDPRNYGGFGNSDLVPTQLIDTVSTETASDDVLADFNGDGLAEMAVGRLPANTVAEADMMVAKIVGYAPATGPQQAVLVADSENGYNFEAANEALLNAFPSNVAVQSINRSSGSVDEVRSRLLSSLNAGPQLVSFFGHGNVDRWTGAGLLTSADAGTLHNSNLSLYVMMTCLTGYFVTPGYDSLAEAVFKSSEGGAAAVWSSSGMETPAEQAIMNRALVTTLYGSPSLTIGEAISHAKSNVQNVEIRKTWIFFGDPSARFR